MPLAIGIGLGPTFGNTGGGYEPEATALFARMTTQPDAARKSLINDLIKALKNSAVWAKLSTLYIMAAHDAQAARRNWIADQYNLTPVASPAFTADRGYQGDGSAAQLSTNFAISAAQQNDAHVGVWDLTNVSNNIVVIGNGNTFILPRTSGGSFLGRVNVTADANYGTVINNSGHSLVNRSGAASSQGYKDGVSSGTNGSGSTVPDTTAIALLGRSGGTPQYSNHQLAASHMGTSLTAQNAADLYSALRTYLLAVGATS